MKRAKTLSKAELKRVLAIVAAGRIAKRNKVIFYLSFYAGLRAKEIAELKIGDVYSVNGEVQRTVLLTAKQTKGLCSRTFIINSKLVKALNTFYLQISHLPSHSPLIRSQKNCSFSANSMCQLVCRIYKESGITGATSHSGRRTSP